jgi:signal transduction histidine kinase
VTPQDAALRAIEALPHPILVIDGADRLVLANAALWRAAGADPARFPPGTALRDLLGLPAFRGLLGPGDPAALAEEALAQDRSIRQVSHLRTADGASLSEAVSLPLAGGGFVLCAVDVTPLRQAEAAARDRGALLDRVLNAQRGGLALFDTAERLVLHNPAYRRHIGATAEALADRPSLREVLEALERSGAFLGAEGHAHLREALEADRRQPRTAQRIRADGSVIRFASTPQPDGGFLIETDDVTDLRRAEDEARRRAAILDGVLEALPHGICVWGPDRRVALLNEAYARLMEGAPLHVGDTLEEVIRRRAEAGEYGPGEAAQVYARELARDLSRPQERRRLRANGTALDVRTAPLPGGGHISVITDITQLWNAEEEARRRASLLETAMATLRHGLVVYGPDHRVRAYNDLAPRLAGHDPHEIWPGRSLEDLITSLHETGRLGPEPEATRMAEAALALDRRQSHRTVRETPDGHVLEVSSDPTPDGGFIITHVDITAVARAEAEAKKRAEVLQAMLENMRHGIALFDADARIVAANALAATMSGLPPDAFRPGRHIWDLRAEQVASGELAQNWRPPHADPDDPHPRLRAPDRYVRPSPSGRMIEVTTDRTPDGGYVRTYTDVTEDRRIRQELERAHSAAEAASEAKSRFLATMSHELRTPLSAVIGYAEALAGGIDPALIPDFADQVQQAGRQVLSLVDDILEVARAGAAEDPASRTPVDPAAVIATVAAAHRGGAEAAQLTFEAEAAPGLPRLLCDERRLRRILRALLDNAVKFTPAGGTVRLSATPDGEGGVAFAVADTGIGMPEADIPRAFEPFTQLDATAARRFGGSGLGLHLSRLLAGTMGATLALDSTPGQGTTATLRMPRGVTISGDEAHQETP